MKRLRSPSRSHWIVLAVCAAIFGASAYAVRRYPAPAVDSATLAALTAKHARLRGNSDEARDAWRKKLQAATTPNWTDERIDALRHRLGAGWTWSVEPRGAGERHATLRAAGLELARWPEYLATIQEAEREPGLVVEGVEFAADGIGGTRKFTRVFLTLRFPRPSARTPANKARPAQTPVRALLVGTARAHRPERSRLPFCAPPAVRLRLPAGLRSGGKARPFRLGPQPGR